MATLTITFTDSEDAYGLYSLGQVVERAKAIEGVGVWSPPGETFPKRVTIEGSKEGIARVFDFFYTDDDAVLSAAQSIEYRKYRAIIQRAAGDIKSRIAAGEFDDDDLTEAIESAGEVIYYSEAALTLRHSSNDDAYLDAYGESEAVDDCIKASFAQAADIREELGDVDNLLDELTPLTDDEKEEAREYVREGLAGELEQKYATGDLALLIADAAVSVRDTDQGQQKVIDFLTEEHEAGAPNI